MANLGALERGEARDDLVFVRGAILPERATNLPSRAKSVLVSDCVLDDDGTHTLGVHDGQAHANRTTVVLMIENVVVQSNHLREVIDHFREVVKSVVELGRGR